MEEDEELGNSKIQRDVRASMCFGLVNRTARKVLNNDLIHSDVALKTDGPFYCEECYSDVIVRKCTDKNDHFAHKGRLSNLFGSGETQLHKGCKEEILRDLQKAFPDGKWATERPIAENNEKGLSELIPDISGRINNKPIAIEVQRSFFKCKVNYKKDRTIYKRGIAILWIIPLKNELGTEYFRPRLFEKFIHTMYFGRVYFWQVGYGAKVLPTHFGRAERWIEENTWFDVELKEEMSAGGYWKIFKTVREPITLDNLIDITKDFTIEIANEWQPDNEELKVPKRLIFKDNQKKWWTDIPTRK
ncbi:MAG: hypothetical protein IPQ02_08605 [Saprospiraceae bacterium]|nr:hypothetical protein [Candidatus Defluviibacterium haderslevense]